MLPRVLNSLHGPLERPHILIDRTTIWGNPFHKAFGMTRAQCVERYEAWILDQPDLLEKIPQLRGKHLVCWCAPKLCHGDILIKIANPELDIFGMYDNFRYPKRGAT